MSVRRYRPKRRLRSEILPLAVIMSLPLALYFAFPSAAVGFRPVDRPRGERVYNAFVSLDSESGAKLLAAARVSWRSDASSRRVRANMLDCGTASEGVRIVTAALPDWREREPTTEEYEPGLLPKSVAAPELEPLPAEKSPDPEPAFPRSDLLKLN